MKKTAKIAIHDDANTIRSRDMTPRATARNANPLTTTTNAKQESRCERNGNGHASQARAGSRLNLLAEKRMLSKERGGRKVIGKPSDTPSKEAIETAAGGSGVAAEGRKVLSRVGPKPGTAAPSMARSRAGAATEEGSREEQATKPKVLRGKSRKRDRTSPREKGTR